MIDDFVKYLLKRNKGLGIIATIILIALFLVEAINNFRSFEIIQIKYPQLIWAGIFILPIIIGIVVIRDKKGHYSISQRRYSRIVIFILLIIITLLVWDQLTKEQIVPNIYTKIAFWIFISAIVLGLLFLIWSFRNDNKPPKKFIFILSELSEGASKEIPKDRHITQVILDALKTQITSKQIEIIHVEEVILNHDRAEEIGRNTKATAVLFGYYTKIHANILLNIRFRVMRRPTYFHPISTEQRIIAIDELDRGVLQLYLARDITSLVEFLVGLFNYSGKEFREALNNFQTAITLIGNDKDDQHDYSLSLDILHMYLGNILFELGEYEASKVEFGKSLELNNHSAKTLHNIGVLNYVHGFFGDSLGYFTKAIEIDKELLLAYRNRAFAYYQNKDYYSAVKDISLYLDKQVKDLEAQNLYAVCLSRIGEHDSAADIFKSIIRQNPKSVNHKIELAREYFRSGQIDASEKVLLKLARRIRNKALAYGELADQKYSRHDYDKAILYYTKAVKFDKRNPDLFFARGCVHQTKQDRDNAINDYVTTTELNDKHVDAYFNLGNLYFQTGKLTLSLVCFDKVIKVDPNYHSAYLNRGRTKYGLKMYSDAVVDFTDYIKVSDEINKIEGYKGRAMAYLALKRFDYAISDFEEILKITPTSNPIKSALAKTLFSYAYYMIDNSPRGVNITTILTRAISLDPSLQELVSKERKFLIGFRSEIVQILAVHYTLK